MELCHNICSILSDMLHIGPTTLESIDTAPFMGVPPSYICLIIYAVDYW